MYISDALYFIIPKFVSFILIWTFSWKCWKYMSSRLVLNSDHWNRLNEPIWDSNRCISSSEIWQSNFRKITNRLKFDKQLQRSQNKEAFFYSNEKDWYMMWPNIIVLFFYIQYEYQVTLLIWCKNFNFAVDQNDVYLQFSKCFRFYVSKIFKCNVLSAKLW